MGGFLAQPASKYSALQFEFFCEYPYSLPCIVGGSLGMISFISELLGCLGSYCYTFLLQLLGYSSMKQ